MRNLGAVAPVGGGSADRPDLAEPRQRQYSSADGSWRNMGPPEALPGGLEVERRNTVNLALGGSALRIAATGNRARVRVLVYESPQTSITTLRRSSRYGTVSSTCRRMTI